MHYYYFSELFEAFAMGTLEIWLISGVINLVIVSIHQMIDPVSMIGYRRSLLFNFLLGPLSTCVFSFLFCGMVFEAIVDYINKPLEEQ